MQTGRFEGARIEYWYRGKIAGLRVRDRKGKAMAAWLVVVWCGRGWLVYCGFVEGCEGEEMRIQRDGDPA